VLRRRSCGRLWNRRIRSEARSHPEYSHPSGRTSLCVPLPVRQRDALSLAAAVFCDDSSGQPKETLDKYRFTGHDGLSDSLCKAFLAGKFVGVDYINGANGVLDWMGASLHAQRLPRIHVKDLYVIPSKMRRFGAFLNLLFVGIG